MAEPILVIMAAGMGSRFGGPKQIKPLGSHGEILLDYSLYDAARAGFSRVVFIINHRIERDFAALMAGRAALFAEVKTVFQETPPARVKPFGTGHAVLSARTAVDAPFAVINADDFYGAEAFRKLYAFLSRPLGTREWCMVGYRLGNTLSENGAVARGVCTVTDGFLDSITERTAIEKTADGARFSPDGGGSWQQLSPEATVSMNCWGFTPALMDDLAQDYFAFTAEALAKDPQGAEFYLPAAVQRRLEGTDATVAVLPTAQSWFGVTYPQDAAAVAAALAALADAGDYPRDLAAALSGAR